MEESYIKPSFGQRLAAVIVLSVMVIGSLLTYGLLISSKGESPEEKRSKELAQLQKELAEKEEKKAGELSKKYFAEFVKFKKAESFNATTANSKGLQKKDLKVGTGKELKKDDTNYHAYYIGYCPDESIFDSSFDDADKPTKLRSPIAGSGLIAGWTEGVIGMKIGGVREIVIPGELAYGNAREICGMKNAPLKFIVMAIDSAEYQGV